MSQTENHDSPLVPSEPSPGTIYVALYVCDLDISVSETLLAEIFKHTEGFVSAKLCTDQITGVSLGYGFVNYHTQEQASCAMEMMNYKVVNGKPMRVMFTNRDPSTRNKNANVFIKNLDLEIDSKALHKVFASFGNVQSCKVATDGNDHSKGYAFVQFEHEEDAQESIDTLNGMLLNEKQVYVGRFVSKLERDQENGSQKFKNLYVKNLPETFTDHNLREEFNPFGTITSAVIMRDENGNSKCFGFVYFEEEDAASAAVEKLNGVTINGKVLYVGRAQKKEEREAELKAKFEQEKKERFAKLKGANLYLKNLDYSLNDHKLKELFLPFGDIISCKVMLDSHGMSKESGFVQYTKQEEAYRAVSEMNGKMIGSKPLYVAIAESKEQRRTRLEAHFSKLNTPRAITPSSSMPMYQPVPPRMVPPQPLYFSQPTAFGFQQQLVPVFRPGVAPNIMMPYQLQRQGQSGQFIGGIRGGMAQLQQQRQVMHWNGNNDAGMGSFMIPQGVRGQNIPVPISSLANATPEQQRMMLGEQLYPLVKQIEQKHANKVTGMLLEMDKGEVLHLIESPDALKNKIREATEVLRSVQDFTADRLGSLSLND